jgi:hypothetical protein
MDMDKWEQLKENLKRKFEIEEEGREELTMDTQEGEVLKGSADFLIMTTPMGRVKLAFEKKPLVLNKKFHFSHRAGQAARTEYEMSDSEFTYKLRAYKWNDIDETWDEIDAEHFG